MILNAEDFFDLSQDLFCIIGTDGRFKKLNPAFQKSIGYRNEELVDQPVASLIHSDDLAAFIRFYSTTGSENNAIIRIVCRDENLKVFSWNGTKTPDNTYIYVSLMDVSRQKEIDAELVKAVNASLHLLNSSLDVIGTINSVGKFMSLNKSCQDLWGFRPEELIGKHWSEIIYPEDINLTYQMAADLLGGKSRTNFENRYVHKNGTVVPVCWSVRWAEEDKMIYFVARNATERKKREEELIFNEMRFRRLVQTGSDMIVVLDDNYQYQYISPTVTSILGHDPEAIKSENLLRFVHNDDKGMLNTALLMASQQYKVEPELFRVIDANGEWRWLKVVITNLLADESINGIVINARDITNQLAAEEQKTQAIRRLNNLIENYTQGYFKLDKNWIIREINPEASRLLNLPKEQLLNHSISDLFSKRTGTSFYEHYEAAIKGNVFVEFEERMESSNKWFVISAYPYEDNLTVFFKEITQEKTQKLLVNLEKDVLEIITGFGSSLKQTVDHYFKGIREIYQLECFLSLHDSEKNLLFPFAGPTVPCEYFDALNKGFIMEHDNIPGCTSMHFEGTYQIDNLNIHSHTKAFAEIFSAHDISSCWYRPINDHENELIGMLVIYHHVIKSPDEKERELLNRVTAFLKLLIDRNQIKERLLISNQKYKYITAATKDATYEWNIENGHMDWGESACKLFGYNEDSTINDWETRIHPADCERVMKSLQIAIDNESRIYWHGEYRYKRVDDSYAHVIDDGYIIRNDDKKPVRMVGAIKDISKLKESALKIVKQNKRLQEIATINSHHMRKPLANILGIIEVIKTANEKELDELVKLLAESGVELDRIVRKIAKKTLV